MSGRQDSGLFWPLMLIGGFVAAMMAGDGMREKREQDTEREREPHRPALWYLMFTVAIPKVSTMPTDIDFFERLGPKHMQWLLDSWFSAGPIPDRLFGYMVDNERLFDLDSELHPEERIAVVITVPSAHLPPLEPGAPIDRATERTLLQLAEDGWLRASWYIVHPSLLTGLGLTGRF